MVLEYAKAAAATVPFASKLPLVPGGGGALPDVTLTRSVQPDPEALAAYAGVCGFRVDGLVPATYAWVMSFPLNMRLMTRGDFPFAPVGLVHLSNRLTQHRPVAASEALDLTLTPRDLRDHHAGRVLDLVCEVRSGDELVFENVATLLRRGGGSGDRPAKAAPPELRGTTVWRVPGDLGRRYASVSGDRNPIHLHPLTAKALGFPRAIAHGMWSAARVLSSLRTPEAFVLDIRFRKPILLPSSVELAVGRPDFFLRSARDADTIHLEGTLNERR